MYETKAEKPFSISIDVKSILNSTFILDKTYIKNYILPKIGLGFLTLLFLFSFIFLSRNATD